MSPIASLLFHLDFGADIPAITFDRVIINCLALVMLTRHLSERSKSPKPIAGEIFMLGFALYVLLSIPFFPHKSYISSFNSFLGRIGDIVLLYYVAKACIIEKQHIYWVIGGILVVATYSAILGVFDQVLGEWALFHLIGIERPMIWTGGSEAGRSCGPFATPYDLSILLAIGVFLAFHVINWSRNKLTRVVCVLLIPLLLIAWYFTYSRSTYISFLLGIALMPFLAYRSRKRYIEILIIGALFLAIAMPIILQKSAMQKRLLDPTNAMGRLITDVALWNMYKSNFWFGAGMGQAWEQVGKYAVPAYGIPGFEVYQGIGSWPSRTNLVKQFSPHNTQITYLAEHGTIGGLLFFLMIILFMVFVLKARGQMPHNGIVGSELASVIFVSYVGVVLFTYWFGFYDATKFPTLLLYTMVALIVKAKQLQDMAANKPENNIDLQYSSQSRAVEDTK
ncbi:MAG: O-antigen ligase family protein [Armatimonadota bacterium]